MVDKATQLRMVETIEALSAKNRSLSALHDASTRKIAALSAQIRTHRVVNGEQAARIVELKAELEAEEATNARLLEALRGSTPVAVDPPVVEPLPGGDEDGSAITVAHDYLERTAADNLTIPRFDWLRANRRPRTRKEGTFIYKANEVHRLEDLEIYAKWASCIGFTSDYPQHRQGKLEVTNVGHNMLPGAKQPTKWGERCWSMSEIHRLDCDYTDIPYEHGDYDNLSGSSSIRRSTGVNLGGHFQYLCLRNRPTPKKGVTFDKDNPATWQYPPNNGLPTKPQLHLVEDCHTRNCNNRAAKGSNMFEGFNLGTREHQATIILRDGTDVNAFPYQLHTGTNDQQPLGLELTREYVRSYAAVVLKAYADQLPYNEVQTHPHRIKLFRVENYLFDYTQANKQLMSLNDCEKIELDRSAFIGRDHRQPFIDVDNEIQDGQYNPTTEITIGDCGAKEIKLRWWKPDGSFAVFDLSTRGRFLRLRDYKIVEDIPYDPAHRAKGLTEGAA